MPLPRAAAYLLVVFAGLAGAARADVFMRIGRRPDQALEQAGGRPVFQTDVNINGQPASLALLGFDRPAGELAPLLARKLGLPVPAASAADAAHIVGIRDARALNLILLPGGRADTTLALLVDQHANAAHKTATSAAWPNLPHPVAAAPIFTAVNLATHTTVAVATATADPEALHAEMQARLQEDGWQPAAPRAKNGGLALFRRGNATLLVFTQSPAANGQTRITLLQRLGHAP